MRAKETGQPFTLADYRATRPARFLPQEAFELEPTFLAWPLPDLVDVPWQELLDAFQEDRCAICDDDEYDLVWDHDHDTGLLRGRLCWRCNALEGSLTYGHRPIFQRYRDWTPMECLGLVAAYPARLRRRVPTKVALAKALRLAAWQFENGHMDRATLEDLILELLTKGAA